MSETDKWRRARHHKIHLLYRSIQSIIHPVTCWLFSHQSVKCHKGSQTWKCLKTVRPHHSSACDITARPVTSQLGLWHHSSACDITAVAGLINSPSVFDFHFLFVCAWCWMSQSCRLDQMFKHQLNKCSVRTRERRWRQEGRSGPVRSGPVRPGQTDGEHTN